MSVRIHRRTFLAAASLAALAPRGLAADPNSIFKISLAQWSLHNALNAKKMDPMDFAKVAKTEYDISAIEYVNTFYQPFIKDKDFYKELKKRADDYNVTSVLIMCDREGELGASDNAKRHEAVDNHKKWVDLAKFLGCHSIRVNAHSDKAKSPEEQQKLVADGLRRLCVYADPHDINVIVENHGGLSSNGKWLVGVMKLVDHKRVGTLPDFGNFGDYDRYLGTQELMPYAKGVSAKSHDFDGDGNETKTDYSRMIKIVLDAGYHGHLGIEYEGKRLTEPEGIRATKKLLERLRDARLT